MGDMKVVLLGFTVADAEIKQVLEHDREMPVQTHTFAWNVVEALRSGDCEVELVSAIPVSNYPRGNPRLFVRGHRFREREVLGTTIGFVNALAVKHLTRFVSGLIGVFRSFRRTSADVLLIHGVHSPFLAIGALVSLTGRAKVVAILTDPPGVVRPTDGRVARGLKRLDRSIVSLLVRRLDGVISLASGLHRMLAPELPSLIIDGIVSESEAHGDAGFDEASREIIYAGGLSEEYGVRGLVEGVLLAQSDAVLRVYGRGPLSEWVEEKAKASPKILGPTLVDRSDLLRQYRYAAGLVQPRPADSALSAASFPSKMMEYFASGVPVITTRLPAIVEDFEGAAYWVLGNAPADYARAIDSFFDTSVAVRKRTAQRARQILLDSRGVVPRGEQFRNFLDSI